MDGATQRASKLIQIEFFLGHREKAASVQFCIAEEFKKRPMKGVRPRYRSHEHGRTRPGPIFGRVVISKNFKFLNGVDRGEDRNAPSGELVVIVAIEQPIGALGARTTD